MTNWQCPPEVSNNKYGNLKKVHLNGKDLHKIVDEWGLVREGDSQTRQALNKFIPFNQPSFAIGAMYVHDLDKKLSLRIFANKASYFEIIRDDFNLGIMLGYPKCCALFFSRNFPIMSRLDNNYEIPVLSA